MSRLAWAMVLFSASFSAAQQRTIEVTKTDFTKVDGVRSTSVSVFGVKLGDTQQEAQANAAFFGVVRSAKQDSKGLVLKSPASGCEMVVSVEDGTVSRITLRQNCASDLAGDAKHLLEAGITSNLSEERLRLLGREDRHEVNDLGYGAGRVELLFYEKEGIQIGNFFDGKDSLTLHFVPPSKRRT